MDSLGFSRKPDRHSDSLQAMPSTTSISIPTTVRPNGGSGPLFCFADDRLDAEPGLRVAVTSLQFHRPGSRMVVLWKGLHQGFIDWMSQWPSVRCELPPPTRVQGWSSKPHWIRSLFDANETEVIWLDSDLMTIDCPERIFGELSEDTIVLAQEPRCFPNQETVRRTSAWNLKVGRTYPFMFNTCVVRLTRNHRQLLEDWCRLTESPHFVELQRLPFHQRPPHAGSDQDLLAALLCSAQYSWIPIRLVPSGDEIIHSGGALYFPVSERLRSLFGRRPIFVHAMGAKPWTILDRCTAYQGTTWKVQRLGQETSPYAAHARTFAHVIEMPTPWLDYATLGGRVLRWMGFGRDALRGLPQTALAQAARQLKKLVRSGRI